MGGRFVLSFFDDYAVIVWQRHRHCEHESGAEVCAFGECVNHASVVLENLLADLQAHTYSICVVFFGALDLAEQFEERVHFFLLDAPSFVDDVDAEDLPTVFILGPDLDLFALGELQSILCQVDQDLLEVDLVAE